MNDTALSKLLNDIESDRAERKASCSDPTKIRQAICAFANDLPNLNQPGVIFVGVHDKGQCADLSITDQLLLTLANMRSDGNILPSPVLTVEKRTLSGCELAVVIVEPHHRRPFGSKVRLGFALGLAEQPLLEKKSVA